MPTTRQYSIGQLEHSYATYVVYADDEEEALDLFYSGEAECIDTEYLEVEDTEIIDFRVVEIPDTPPPPPKPRRTWQESWLHGREGKVDK